MEIQTDCCIVGGGPAGLILGYLLARGGVNVVVAEKHADFLRDFRGDTIHPSTLEVMSQLGLLDEFLKLPHNRAFQMNGYIENEQVTIADFKWLPSKAKFIAFMPQWDFLNFVASKAQQLPNFRLMMETQMNGLIEEGVKVCGATGTSAEGKVSIRSQLVVAADGRHSVVRHLAGFKVNNLGAPIDVLWMRLSRKPSDPSQPLGRVSRGRILVMLDRGNYWQCAYVIPKGEFDSIQTQGLENFQKMIAKSAPFVHDRIAELNNWEQVRLLTVMVDRLENWYREGVLCIGDAAHAMSPIGGVGINLAIQDAVAAANILVRPLREKRVSSADLQKVQARRMFPTRVTQAFQVFMQNRVIGSILKPGASIQVPAVLRLLKIAPILQALPAYAVGIGVRPELPDMKLLS